MEKKVEKFLKKRLRIEAHPRPGVDIYDFVVWFVYKNHEKKVGEFEIDGLELEMMKHGD